MTNEDEIGVLVENICYLLDHDKITVVLLFLPLHQMWIETGYPYLRTHKNAYAGGVSKKRNPSSILICGETVKV